MYTQAVQQPGAGQQRWRVLRVLLELALLLQVAGLLAPGWVVVSVGSVSVHIGLWFLRMCNGDACKIHSTNYLFSYASISGYAVESSFTEYKAETCTALCCCIIAISLAKRSRATAFPGRMYGVSAFFAVISGILALVPSGNVLNDTIMAGNLMKDLINVNPYDPPYALIMTLAGGCLACIAALVCGWYMFQSLPDQLPVVNQPQAMTMQQYVSPVPTILGPTQPAAISGPPPNYTVVAGGYTTEKSALIEERAVSNTSE